MTAITTRIPAPQHLWDALLSAGAEHLLSRLGYERVRAVYASDPATDHAVRIGRNYALAQLCDAINAARRTEDAAIAALAEAQAKHVMGERQNPQL